MFPSFTPLRVKGAKEGERETRTREESMPDV